MSQITSLEAYLLLGLSMGLIVIFLLSKKILNTKIEFKAEIDYMKTELRSKKIYFLGTSMEIIFNELKAKTQTFPDQIFEIGRHSKSLENFDWGNNFLIAEFMKGMCVISQDMPFCCAMPISRLLRDAYKLISNEVDFEFKTLTEFLQVKRSFDKRLSEWDDVLESVDKLKKNEKQEEE